MNILKKHFGKIEAHYSNSYKSYEFDYDDNAYRIDEKTLFILQEKGLTELDQILNRCEVLSCCNKWIDIEYPLCSCGESVENNYWNLNK